MKEKIKSIKKMKKEICFAPKTQKIQEIADKHIKVIGELKKLFEGNVNVYIDYANIRPWSEKLHWHIYVKHLKQFLDSL